MMSELETEELIRATRNLLEEVEILYRQWVKANAGR
jgi:hypothetical protein